MRALTPEAAAASPMLKKPRRRALESSVVSLPDMMALAVRVMVFRLPAAQQQGVADHAHAAEGHRRAGDHRAQQAEGGERNAGEVVDERPEQVLANLAIGAPRDRDGIRHAQ